MYALRERDGKQLWSAPLSIATPSIIANNTLYTLSGSKTIALNASTGAPIWQSAEGFFNFIVALNQGGLYANGYDTKTHQRVLQAMKLSDGSILWTVPMPVSFPRLVRNGVVYLTAASGNCPQPATSDVYAVQTSDGHSLWHVHQ